MSRPTRAGPPTRPHRRSPWRREWWGAQHGQVTAFVVVLTTGILTLGGLVLDGGLALATKVDATGQAEAAARAGAQAIDLTVYRTHNRVELDRRQARSSAHRYLDTIGASGTVTVTQDTVTVTITTSQPTQLLGLVGITALSVQATGSAHPQPG